MIIYQRLYQATNQASLVDYAIFNQDTDKEKNSFLIKLYQAISKAQWFDLYSYTHIKDRKFTKQQTQVPKIDEETQKNEADILQKIFNEEELEKLAEIIQNLNSNGVLPIKELRDDQDIANTKKPFIQAILKHIPFLRKSA